MELRHLRYFLAVAEDEHVGRAAERLHISSSPLSRQIQQLERELDVRLFDRIGRNVQLTPAGRAFLTRARQVLADVERARMEAQSVARGEVGRLSLAFSDTPAFARMMPEVIRRIRAAHPQVALDVAPQPSAEQLVALREGSLDVGFCHDAPTGSELSTDPLHVERVLLAVPRDHPLASVRTVRSAMLADQAFVWPRGPKPRLLDEIERALRERGISLQIALEARSSAETRLGLVASGMGLTFALASSESSLPPEVVLRPVVDLKIDGRAHLVWRTAETANPLIRSVRRAAQEVRRALFPA